MNRITRFPDHVIQFSIEILTQNSGSLFFLSDKNELVYNVNLLQIDRIPVVLAIAQYLCDNKKAIGLLVLGIKAVA